MYNAIACEDAYELVEVHSTYLQVSVLLILKLVLSMNSTTYLIHSLRLFYLYIYIYNYCQCFTQCRECLFCSKMAAVTPILKKPVSDITDMSNFRPISNLPFLAKVLERVVVGQLHTHLCTNSLLETFQSGFRSGHSTETAIVRVLNDLLVIADSGACAILALKLHSIPYVTAYYWTDCICGLVCLELCYPGLNLTSQIIPNLSTWVLTDLRLCLCVRVSLRGQFWILFYLVFLYATSWTDHSEVCPELSLLCRRNPDLYQFSA